MMVVKLFGLLDIIAGIILVYLSFNNSSLASFFVIYLLLKGLLFYGGFASIMDILAGIFIGLAAMGNFYSLSWLFVIWLIQKGILSLLF